MYGQQVGATGPAAMNIDDAYILYGSVYVQKERASQSGDHQVRHLKPVIELFELGLLLPEPTACHKQSTPGYECMQEVYVPVVTSIAAASPRMYFCFALHADDGPATLVWLQHNILWRSRGLQWINSHPLKHSAPESNALHSPTHTPAV